MGSTLVQNEKLKAENYGLKTKVDVLMGKLKTLEEKGLEYRCQAVGYEKRLVEITMTLREHGQTQFLRK